MSTFAFAQILKITVQKLVVAIARGGGIWIKNYKQNSNIYTHFVLVIPQHLIN